MAEFSFYDKKKNVTLRYGSMESSQSEYIEFKRISTSEHIFSDEVYFKKTDVKNQNQAAQFIFDKWYLALKIEDVDVNEQIIIIKEYMEASPNI